MPDFATLLNKADRFPLTGERETLLFMRLAQNYAHPLGTLKERVDRAIANEHLGDNPDMHIIASVLPFSTRGKGSIKMWNRCYDSLNI